MDHSKKKDGESLYHVMLAGSLIFLQQLVQKPSCLTINYKILKKKNRSFIDLNSTEWSKKSEKNILYN